MGQITYREGWGGENPQWDRDVHKQQGEMGGTYDPAGNLTNAGGARPSPMTPRANNHDCSGIVAAVYDGNRLRGKKDEGGAPTYYLRSTVLGGQVVAETLDRSGI